MKKLFINLTTLIILTSTGTFAESYTSNEKLDSSSFRDSYKWSCVVRGRDDSGYYYVDFDADGSSRKKAKKNAFRKCRKSAYNSKCKVIECYKNY